MKNKQKEKYIKLDNLNKNYDFKSDAQKIKYPIILVKDSSADYSDNCFCLFESIGNIHYLVYAKERSIIFYDLNSNNILNEIKNSHLKNVTNLRYYFEGINKRDLILSVSNQDSNIKLWNIKNFECLLNLENIYEYPSLDSACFLNNKNQFYILASNSTEDNDEPPDNNPMQIKVYDLEGNMIKEIKDSKYSVYLIDTYYDSELSKNYIITGNIGYVKSYDYGKNEVYHKYSEKDAEIHRYFNIYNSEHIIKLIESNDGYYDNGCVRIWDFHSGNLLEKIKCDKSDLNGMCLWNDNYLFICYGLINGKMMLIDLKKKITKTFGENEVNIKKINHRKYGECLISQGYKNIKLWINENFK